ncbi:MAG: hypothetical protein FWF87_07805 [Synergistaceae bacterium]|nr:hypothetical protein [Synergistaceae bacterium]
MKHFFVARCLVIILTLLVGFVQVSDAATAKKQQTKQSPSKAAPAEAKLSPSVASADKKSQETATVESQPHDVRMLEDLTARFAKSADLSPASAPVGTSIPPARIEEAEIAFMRAWKHFIMRNYWQALSFLDQAQKANIFLVDVYYLRGLILRKIGEFSLASKSISNFLEVRTRDLIAPNVLKGISENKSELELIISESSYPVRCNVSQSNIYDSLNTGYFRPYSSKGLGKLSGFNSDLCFPDTIGNQVFFRTNGDAGQFNIVKGINSPVKALLPGDGSIYVINIDGEICQIMNDSSFDRKGGVDCDSVSDACYISAAEIAVADPVSRKIKFYSWPEMKYEDEWQPDKYNSGDYLFEPVAVKAYAYWLATADRANGRIYFIDLRNKRSFFVENINVRDIIWSSLGLLLSVNEDSEISAHFVDFTNKSADKEVLRSELNDAWAFFEYKGEIFCSDISGNKIWKITLTPNLDLSPAFLSLYDPEFKIDENGNAVLSVCTTFSSPFPEWVKEIMPTAMSVWNERIITTSVTSMKAPSVMGLCFSRGNADGMITPKMRVIPVESCAELYGRLPLIWSNQRDLITNFILDSLIIYNHEELLKLTAFCLFNGVKIDIWARGMPSVELMRASAATGGEVYYSIFNEPMLISQRRDLKLQLLLADKTEASGYPDRSTLSSYLSIRQLSGRDWIPIWIDAVGK